MSSLGELSDLSLYSSLPSLRIFFFCDTSNIYDILDVMYVRLYNKKYDIG